MDAKCIATTDVLPLAIKLSWKLGVSVKNADFIHAKSNASQVWPSPMPRHYHGHSPSTGHRYVELLQRYTLQLRQLYGNNHYQKTPRYRRMLNLPRRSRWSMQSAYELLQRCGIEMNSKHKNRWKEWKKHSRIISLLARRLDVHQLTHVGGTIGNHRRCLLALRNVQDVAK